MRRAKTKQTKIAIDEHCIVNAKQETTYWRLRYYTLHTYMYSTTNMTICCIRDRLMDEIWLGFFACRMFNIEMNWGSIQNCCRVLCHILSVFDMTFDFGLDLRLGQRNKPTIRIFAQKFRVDKLLWYSVPITFIFETALPRKETNCPTSNHEKIIIVYSFTNRFLSTTLFWLLLDSQEKM